MGKGFEINRRAVRQMQKELEREFKKNPVKVPIEPDMRRSRLGTSSGGAVTNNYHGPVVTVNGDHAQVAFDADQITQHGQSVAEGYVEVAEAIKTVLESLPSLDLPSEDLSDLELSAEAVLAEVVRPEPERKTVRRHLNQIKGALATTAQTGVHGASAGVATALSGQLIEMLSQLQF